jgi:hypothetical protein
MVNDMWRLKANATKITPALVRDAASLLGANTLHRLKLPNFIGIGSGRCGTTHLYGLLSSHPDFYLSPLKEVNYFGIKQSPFAREGWSSADYKFCFATQENQKYIGEITPVYIAQTVSLQQISSLLGKIKILITLRNPLDRFISHFSYHQHQHKIDDVNAYAAVALERYLPGYFRLDWQSPEKAIELSLYAPGVRAAVDLFGRQNVLILFYEDLTASDRQWKRSLSDFFNSDLMATEPPANTRNAGGTAAVAALSSENRSRLRQLFISDAVPLSNLLNRDMIELWGLN